MRTHLHSYRYLESIHAVDKTQHTEYPYELILIHFSYCETFLKIFYVCCTGRGESYWNNCHQLVKEHLVTFLIGSNSAAT